ADQGTGRRRLRRRGDGVRGGRRCAGTVAAPGGRPGVVRFSVDSGMEGQSAGGESEAILVTLAGGAVMNKEEKFLQDIRENPGDDALLLEYAEWLERPGGVPRQHPPPPHQLRANPPPPPAP